MRPKTFPNYRESVSGPNHLTHVERVNYLFNLSPPLLNQSMQVWNAAGLTEVRLCGSAGRECRGRLVGDFKPFPGSDLP